MSNLHEIKHRIDGVRSTKKITRAMYLISASKSRKAKHQLEMARPYFHNVASTLANILAGGDFLETPYLRKTSPENGKRLFVVLGADKGMGGAYNHNLIQYLLKVSDPSKDRYYVAGFLTHHHLSRKELDVESTFNLHVIDPDVYRARTIAERISREFFEGKYSEIFIVYTSMASVLSQEPVSAKLLPLSPETFKGIDVQKAPYYNHFEPSSGAVFDTLVPHYLKGIIYGALVEAFTSEQQSRMLAMDNATKSADTLLGELSLKYNRARQAAITNEISEIVGGSL